MRLKFFITYIMIMLCFIMGSMSELPHHHHNGKICMNFNHMKRHHAENNHKNGNCTTCCYNTINAYRNKDTEKTAKITVADIIPDMICVLAFNNILINHTDDFTYSSLYLEKLHSRHLIESKGLRSPPAFLFS